MASGNEEVGQEAAPLAGPATVSVITYNILAGGGKRLKYIAEVIRDVGADLVGMQEVLRPDWVCTMAEALGMHYVIGTSPDRWHMALLSRYPIVETRSHTGPQFRRALLEAVVEVPHAGTLRLFVTHLHAGFNAFRAGESQRLREVSFVIERMRQARLRGEPHLLLGDLNSLAPGERLEASRVLRHALDVEKRERAEGRRLQGHPNLDNILPPAVRPLRPLLVRAFGVPPVAWISDQMVNLYVPRAVVRRLIGAGYTDLYAASHPDPHSRGFTCPQPDPGGRIDYIFADPRSAAGLVTCEIIVDGPGRDVTHASDHRPIVATLRLGA
jgi:endonuclease/exonuclease/phosphatase family metal-dependent hydrolase